MHITELCLLSVAAKELLISVTCPVHAQWGLNLERQLWVSGISFVSLTHDEREHGEQQSVEMVGNKISGC